MKRLTSLDSGFLFLEKRNQPLHVAFLTLLRPPPDAPEDFARKMVERLRSYGAPLPPFNQRLERRLGAGYWVEDPEFDIDQHVIHLSLPPPGRVRDLLAMVSRMHASHLDRAYPLWRLYVIEGVEGGRIATYSKVHHAVADGVAGTRLMLKSMSTDPEQILPPTWALPPRGRRERPAGLLAAPVGRAAKLAAGFRAAFGSVPGVARELRETWHEARIGHPDVVTGAAAPGCVLNQPVSASRRFAAQTYSQLRAKKAARALGCTVNDVVLGMCASALRQYLSGLQALPAAPLIAGVPVSTRRDHSESGNQIAFMLVNLGTHLADPASRLAAIRASVDHNKQRFVRMKAAEILGYSVGLMAPGLFNMLTVKRPQHLAFNLVISNVPGQRSTLYWQGCEVESMYPVSVVADGMALNISLTSRADGLDFGLIACRRTLPHVQRLLDYLEVGLQEIEALAERTG
ncbi:WS/DGAT/MGAT family O-acyltransferase [Panacagrimonas sp.]|uniref:WS/DGAT/MGAT family O-acyltransferase n=1 Tax=Panacagrimonas sp. TaxID=2480088 RepID=UPI003B52B6BE